MEDRAQFLVLGDLFEVGHVRHRVVFQFQYHTQDFFVRISLGLGLLARAIAVLALRVGQQLFFGPLECDTRQLP